MSVREQLMSSLRLAQTFLPGGSDAKYRIQRAIRAYRRRPFERDFEALAQLNMPEGRSLVDVGANRGQSIDALRLCKPGFPILSFEPNSLLFSDLDRRYGGSEDVTLYKQGLGEIAGSFDLYVPFYRGYMYDGLASLDADEASGWLRGRVAGFNERRLEVRRVPVQVLTLDSLNVAPAFIKIDVQGTEIAALKGGINTLKEFHPVLLIETPSEALLAFLLDLGYRPYTWDGWKMIEGAGSTANTFFI